MERFQKRLMKLEVQIGGEPTVLECERREDHFTLKLLQRALQGDILRWKPPFFTLKVCEHLVAGAFYRHGDHVDVHLPTGNFRIRFATSTRAVRGGPVAGGLTSPMPGKVIQVFV